jgi:thymidylate synthase
LKLIKVSIYNKMSHTDEVQYLNLLREIQSTGVLKKGRNGYTKSLFGKHLKFDVSERFPLLTTKKMFFRGIVEELLFFIRGETDSKKLEEKGINIWKGNTERGFLDAIGMKERKEGIMGPLYGYQWRHFNAEYDGTTGTPTHATHALSVGACAQGVGGLDQLANVIHLIKTQPESRRILLTDFNPLQASQGVLYPCHSIIIQFYVDETSSSLDMFCYNRSQDVFLGTPFNIASSALFLILIAKITGLCPRFLHMSLGDTHIYSQHEEPVSLQLSRQPYVFPVLNITKEIKNLEDVEKLTFQDFKLEEYQSHPSIKAEMVA